MAALQRPLSIGAEADPLLSHTRHDLFDLPFDACRSYAKLSTSSSSRQTSRAPLSSPGDFDFDFQAHDAGRPNRLSNASKMLSNSLAQYDGSTDYPFKASLNTVTAVPNEEHPTHWRDEAAKVHQSMIKTEADYEVPRPPSPPPAPPLPALSGSENRDHFCFPSKSASTAKAFDGDVPKRSTPIWEWCANMVCYIWFAGVTPEPSPALATTPCRSPTPAFNAPLQSSPLAHRRHRKSDSLGSLSECHKFSAHDLSQAVEAHLRASTDPIRSPSSVAADRARDRQSLRLSARHRFKVFVKDMLNTTQVSNSVILLALLYIHRLKSRHPALRGEEGSEFRLFITALMLGNKFLDDHTYTNKTWSELSGIELKDITRMEVEFWLGLSMSIYVSDVDFRHWIRTLEQLAQRRQQALIRREQEAARKVALRQQQQQLARHRSARRHLQQSRAGQSQPWSPQGAAASNYLDGAGSPYRASIPATGPLLLPSAPVAEESLRRLAQDGNIPAYRLFPDSDSFDPLSAQVSLAPVHASDSRRLSPSANTYTFPSARTSSVGYRDAVCGPPKRPLATLHADTPYPSYSSPSPERPRKRLAGLDAIHAEHRVQRTSLSPCDEALGRYLSTNPVREGGHDGVSPLAVQPYPRSVFEPLVTTPNTLLAPYVSHQTAQPQPHRHHPLAYWQLAAGHDRGILGVHLPAPIATSNEHYTPADGPRRASGSSTPHLRLSRRPINTITPYPTPNPVPLLDSMANSGLAPALSSYLPGLERDAAELGGGLADFAPAASDATHFAQAGVRFGSQTSTLPQQRTYHAPHAPFNNAEGSYVDPFARYF